MPRLATLIAAAVLACLAAAPARALDFDCTTARAPTETAICSSPVLSQLDERMARFYGWLWAALDDTQRVSLRSEQRKFLAKRDACAEDMLCLRSSYLARIDDLSARLRQTTAARALPEMRHSSATGSAVRG